MPLYQQQGLPTRRPMRPDAMKNLVNLAMQYRQSNLAQEQAETDRMYKEALADYYGQRVSRPTEEISKLKLNRIQDLLSKRQSGEISSEEDAILDRMLGGGSMVSVNIEKPAPATALKEITEYQGILTTLEDMGSLMEKTKDLQGPGRQALTDAQMKYGKLPVVGEMIGGLPESGVIEFMQLSKQGMDILARLRTGAAINENELKLYTGFLPKLEYPYETNKRNYEIFKKFVQGRIHTLQTAYKSLGYKVPESEKQTQEMPVPESPAKEPISGYSRIELEKAITKAKSQLPETATKEEILDKARQIWMAQWGSISKPEE